MILTSTQMKQVEEAAFKRGIKAADLMEQAGEGIARVIEQFFPIPGTCVVYCGKGHNAGDALVAARVLAEQGWKMLVRLAFSPAEMATLSQSHLQKLTEDYHGEGIDEIPKDHHYPLVLLDGILGIGSQGAPRDVLGQLIEEMNALHRERAAFVVAVDLPSGLDATTGIPATPCVQADLTVTIAYAKTGLLADRATNYVGRLALVPLLDLKAEEGDTASLIRTDLFRKLLPPRSFDVHKGVFGRVGIIAGSRGYLGAARLASTASLHGGAGLVTLYALPEIYELLATVVPPEVMVKPIHCYTDVLLEKLDALAIGPGLGSQHHAEILEVIEKATCPCVVDADALNALSLVRNSPSAANCFVAPPHERPRVFPYTLRCSASETSCTSSAEANWERDLLTIELAKLLKCQGPRLLTPHPGEMERLFPAEGRTRATWASDFVKEVGSNVTLLLKGARTVIAESGKPLAYNTTGNPGMASGGMGDVLTGVTAAFLARGLSCREAAMLGAWLCGYAAELAVYHGTATEESLVASDIISYFGRAMKGLREGVG